MANKTLRVGTLSRIGTVDIRTADDSNSSMVLKEIFETPYALPSGPENPEPLLLGEPLRLEPGDPQKPVYSSTVRSGVIFSDGTPLTAEIMKTSLMKDDDFRGRATVETQGERIFFKLHAPNANFPMFLAHTSCGIVLQKGDRLFGTGPFMFPEGKSARELTQMNPLILVKNPKYRKPVSIDEIHFAAYPASTAGGTDMLLKAAKDGEIDFTYSLTSVDAAELQGHPFIPSISTGNSTGLLIFNNEAPALKNPIVRRAIARSIDRRQIATKIYTRNPLAYIAPSILPPIMGREAKESLSFSPKDVAALLEKEKVTLPSKLTLQVLWSPRPYLPNPREAAEIIRQSLQAININVELVQPKSRDEFLDNLKRGKFEMSEAGWIADTPDAADFLEACLSSKNISSAMKVTSTSNNHARYMSPEMDQALDDFRREPSATNRARIMEILERDAPLLPLIYGQSVAIYNRKVRGYRSSAVAVGRMSFSQLDLAD